MSFIAAGNVLMQGHVTLLIYHRQTKGGKIPVKYR